MKLFSGVRLVRHELSAFSIRPTRCAKPGLPAGLGLENTLVIDGDRLFNPGKQRFRDEFVRHKILDAVGDMKLVGAPAIARFEGYRSSHALNAAVLRRLFSDPGNYERIAA